MGAWLQKLLAAAFLFAQIAAVTPQTAHGPGPEPHHHDQVECVVCAAGHTLAEFIAPTPVSVWAPRRSGAAYRFGGFAGPERSTLEAGFEARPRAPPRLLDL